MAKTKLKNNIFKVATALALTVTFFFNGGTLIAEVNSATDEVNPVEGVNEDPSVKTENTNLEISEEESNQTNKQEIEELYEVEMSIEEVVESVEEAPVRAPRLSNDVARVATEAELIAEVQDIVNTPGTTKTIIITADITLTDEIALDMAHGKNVIIQGDQQSVTLTAAENKKHIVLSGAAATTLTFDNIKFQGLIEDSRFINGEMDLIDVVNAPNAGGLGGVFNNGTILVNNSEFTRNKSAKADPYASAFKVKASKAVFDNVSFIGNFSEESGSAISINGEHGENTEIVINNSSFISNGVNGTNSTGGAVAIRAGNTPVTITNSVFEYNQLKSGNTRVSTPSGGGAVTIAASTRTVFIDNSFFDSNQILQPIEGMGATADGGALYINEISGKVELVNSTFVNNVSHDEGGGASFYAASNSNNRVANCTFVGNIAKGAQQYDISDGGGAIDFNGTYLPTRVTFEHNTVYGNKALSSQPNKNHGGGVSYYIVFVTSRNNIISGNEATTDDANSTNVYEYIWNAGTSGVVDTNSIIDGNVEEIFGVANPELQAYGNNIVGADGNKRTVLTLPIRPEGLADDKVTATVLLDKNGNQRDTTAGLADVGALEMKWVKHIANIPTRSWALPQEGLNTGVVFYGANHPDAIYIMAPYGNAEITTHVKPTEPAGLRFVHWNGAIDGSGTVYAPATSVQFDMTQNHTVHGIWQRIATLTVTYDANGGTGTVPQDPTAYELNDQVTVLGQGTITKAGHTFMGWNLQADGSGQQLNENDVFVIGADTVLHAQWKLEAVPNPEVKPEVKPVVTAAPIVSGTYVVPNTGAK